jgi:hypothetical protein
MFNCQKQNNSLIRQKAYVWSKYFQELEDHYNTTYITLEKIINIINIPEIPNNIRDELIDCIIDLSQIIDKINFKKKNLKKK